MITVKNYFEKKDSINWELVDPKTVKGIEQAENIISLVNEYPDMADEEEFKQVINIFLKEVNKQFKGKTSTTRKANTAAKKQVKKSVVVKPKSKRRLSTKQQIENTEYFKMLVPEVQKLALIEANSSENDEIIARVEKELSEIPKEQQGDNIKKSTVFAHYFHGRTDWYITDILENKGFLFGYTILNGDTQNAEAGYLSIEELTKKPAAKTVLKYGFTELDFYFEKDVLENILYKKYPDDYPKPKASNKTATPKITAKKTIAKPRKKTIKKIYDIKTVDHFSTEYRLIRRFYNLIRLNKTVSFRKIQLVYMAFQKAALDRSIRKSSKDADLFTKVNKKVVALFDMVNPLKNDANIDFTDKKLYQQMETFVKEQKVNYAITLLKSFVAMQGYQPELAKVNRLIKRINNAIEKEKVNKDNRLYKELVKAKLELESYLGSPNEKITPELVGLSKPSPNLCVNRVKCEGIRKNGKLKKGHRFLEGGNVIASKKKAV